MAKAVSDQCGAEARLRCGFTIAAALFITSHANAAPSAVDIGDECLELRCCSRVSSDHQRMCAREEVIHIDLDTAAWRMHTSPYSLTAAVISVMLNDICEIAKHKAAHGRN
jgi:hypothetical protein